ncbi:right-handed parallel beta-helix repeat-containing protein [Priestia aryabhattai]|uniref:right-handed parallel beta-helix repeat-containing protein n=1 Tax=Priestia aryabhattai TaxID=412384 RepID=UPI003D28E4C7
MYQVGNSVEQVFGGTVIKQGDRTPLGFNFRTENGELVYLTGSTVQVKVASNKGVVLEKQATISDEYTAQFAIGSQDITGAGDMRIEFIVTYPGGTIEKFPSDDWQRIRITPTLEDVEKYGVGYITFEKLTGELQNQFDEFTGDVNQQIDDQKKRVDNLISSTPQPSEIVDAHLDVNGYRYNTVKERIDAEQNKLDAIFKKGIYGKKFITIDGYQKKTPETADHPRISRAIADAPAGATIIFSDTSYDIGSTITITKPINLLGFDAELKTVTNGMDNTFRFSGVDGFSIVGIKFNQNLKGRTSIDIANCKHFHIERCYFTGYSCKYAYYQTDGGIRISSSEVGKIMFNTWEDHGQQYTEDTATLNRCITIQGYTSDHITVVGNTFNRVNQGIIVGCGANNTFIGNTFREVHDNSFYILHWVRGLTISGNIFDDKFDECIVLSGRNITISGNTFKDVPNKFISITSGGVTNLTVTGNTFDIDRPNAWVASIAYVVDDVVISNGKRYVCTISGTSGTTGPSHTSGTTVDGTVTWQYEDEYIDPGVIAGLLVVRNTIGYPPLNNIVFCDNTVKGAFGYAVIQLQNVRGFKCEGNNFDVSLTNDYDHIIKINAPGTSEINSNISIRRNDFKQSGSGANIYAIRIDGTSCADSVIDGNTTVGSTCRMAIAPSDVLIRNQYRSSLGYLYTAKNNVIESDSMPTAGSFKTGDLVINPNVNESGSNGAKYATYGWRRLTTGSNHVVDVDWRVMKLPLMKDNGGIATFSGNGSTTSFVISHGLGSTPGFAYIMPASADAKGDYYVSFNSTNLTINYATPPISGTNNISLIWNAKG